ncbi:hypothetical protein EG68_10923 [Paragonimus skrjabini miyazakii]|uniref:Uncharacterized protein n=1 Tax=Paragonimus skrjabini miyazakii TaxID=59628 RepID=A0A8S9YKV0_9TREM|nr:hypothetical protein EG68_10923 [Paragonimus skrjabini miyazakii]
MQSVIVLVTVISFIAARVTSHHASQGQGVRLARTFPNVHCSNFLWAGQHPSQPRHEEKNDIPRGVLCANQRKRIRRGLTEVVREWVIDMIAQGMKNMFPQCMSQYTPMNSTTQVANEGSDTGYPVLPPTGPSFVQHGDGDTGYPVLPPTGPSFVQHGDGDTGYPALPPTGPSVVQHGDGEQCVQPSHSADYTDYAVDLNGMSQHGGDWDPVSGGFGTGYVHFGDDTDQARYLIRRSQNGNGRTALSRFLSNEDVHYKSDGT